MNIVGIICEYNPFHNGHKYHLEKIKEMFPDSIIILVMSGNFTERGIPSIIDKWNKTEIALEMGIDLVVELPFAFATQSADIFAHGSISILKELKANCLVFGSENNNVEKLTMAANYVLNDDSYQEKVKMYLDKGYNYPTSLNMAFPKEYESIKTPNDLLAFSYIKEIMKQKANITPISIQRTNAFHSMELSKIASSTSIRKALEEKKDITYSVPKEVANKLNGKLCFQNDYFPFLKYKILSSPDLTIYQTVDEGIDKRIQKEIASVTNWEELIQSIKTKRYTYNRINRMLIHILCNFTKEQANKWHDISYIRVLGFSRKGQKYLNGIKKEMSLPLVTTFSRCQDEMLKYEQTVTSIYASVFTQEKQNEIIKSEYQNQPKMREH